MSSRSENEFSLERRRSSQCCRCRTRRGRRPNRRPQYTFEIDAKASNGGRFDENRARGVERSDGRNYPAIQPRCISEVDAKASNGGRSDKKVGMCEARVSVWFAMVRTQMRTCCAVYDNE